MTWKTTVFLIFLSVLGIVFTSFFAGSVLMGQVVGPFSLIVPEKPQHSGVNTYQVKDTEVKFVDAEFESEWIPWIIKQASILVGALSLLVFGFAGFQLIVHGDNAEQLTASLKMIVFGVLGIAIAAFSYTIIANLLTLLST